MREKDTAALRERNPVVRIITSAFGGRRGHTGKGIEYRQVNRQHLGEMLRQMQDLERQRAARIAASHEDDDDRGPAALALAIHDEILDGLEPEWREA